MLGQCVFFSGGDSQQGCKFHFATRATFFASGGIFLSVDILFLKACYGKKFEVKIVVAVGDSTFLESVLCF